MRNYQKQQFLHPNNKLSKYIKLNKKDKFIRDFIDYIGFYWSRVKTDWFYLFASDNGSSAYVDRIEISRGASRSWNLLLEGFYSYFGYTVKLFRIMELEVQSKMVLKVDFYGRGLLVVNKENLWSSVEKLFTKFFWMDEITITRTDYTCDCAKYNFRKVNTLNAKIRGKIEKKDGLEYIVFGRKGKSARVLRYYDKKKEILTRGTSFLYTDYFGYSEIMRYELQVNSEGFDKYEREIKISQLKDYANFGCYLPDNQAKHIRRRDESILEWIKRWIRKFVRDNDKESLEKIDLYFEDLKNRWILDSLVWWETSEVERLTELS